MTNHEPAAAKAAPQSPSAVKSARIERWLFAFLILMVGYVQWPMLKGIYYRTFPAQAGAVQSVAWETDFQKAAAKAVQTGKPLLVDFSASWCPPCQVMKHDVWTDAQVREAAEKGFVPVLLDIDRPENQPIAQSYGIQSIPAILVLDAKGVTQRQAGFMSLSDTLDFLAGKT